MNMCVRNLMAMAAVLFMVPGCSQEPPVEQEVVAPTATSPKEEAPAPPQSGGTDAIQSQPASEAAAPVQPEIKVIEGFRLTHTPSQPGVGEMHFLIPEDWKEGQPTSMMRLYQATIPGAEGQEGEAAFFAPIGGSVEDNINRWTGQFTQPDGSDSKTKTVVEDIQGDLYKIKIVSLTGTMATASMPGKPRQPEKTGWMMLGAIIETPEGPWFIKATGPEKTLIEAREKFLTLCKSVHIIGAPTETGTAK